MYNSIFYLIIAIIIVDFVFERIIDGLNSSSAGKQIPEELQGIYDEKEYQRQQTYKQVNDRFGLLTSSFSFVLILLMFLFQGFAIVNSWAMQWTTNYILLPLLFFGILGLASDIITTPFSIYSTFVIEEKFGFNKITPKIYITDKLKGWGVSLILGGGIFSIILWFYHVTGENFWIYTWLLISGFSLFMSMFYSNIIVPLFNKQTPLPEGELRDEINQFAAKVGFDLTDIFVIDGSKRSTKANAYFTGLGSKKRIVLYDTLINDLTTEEIIAVLAHEIGHYKKKHTIQSLIISIIETGASLYVLSWMIKNPALSEAMGVKEPQFHIALIAFGMIYTPISFILGIFMNLLSRKNEYEADRFAATHYHEDPLISALKKLSQKSLSNLTPHSAYVFFHYSHPTLLQRIRHLKCVKQP